MTEKEICDMETAAWSAFFAVMQAHGLSALQRVRFTQHMDNKNGFDIVGDCLDYVVNVNHE